MSTQKERSRKHYLKNKEKICERTRKWYLENREKIKTTKRKYYLLHKDEILAREKKWRLQNPKRDKLLKNRWAAKNKKLLCLKSKKRLKDHPEYFSKYARDKRKIDIQFRIKGNLRSRLYSVIKGNAKKGSAIKDLGCTILELKLYIEGQFKSGMRWENWSKKGWHIDHKLPLDSFDLSNREQFLEACHYTNLQPMWAKENLKKKNKIL